MAKKLTKFAIMSTILCSLSTAYAMGGTPPPTPTEEVELAPSASEEALAKEQVENLRDISINSKDVAEGYGKFVKHVMGGKRYLYEFNSIAQKQLIKDALDKKQDWKYRFAIIGSLNPDNPPEAFDIRVKILKDRSEKVELRRYAIGSVASTKREDKQHEAVDVLIKALKDDDWDIVLRAANGLGELKDKRAVEPLIASVRRTRKNLDELLKSGWTEFQKGGTKPEEAALSCSIRALGEIGDNRAVPALIEVLNDSYIPFGRLEDGTKGWAIIALRKINGERAIEPIKEVLKTTQNYRIAEVAHDALKALAKEKKDIEKGINQ